MASHQPVGFIFSFLFPILVFGQVNLSTADFVCDEASNACYQKIYEDFEVHRTVVAAPSGLVGKVKNSSSLLRLQPKRTKTVFLMIHGLWSTERHFDPLAEWLSENKKSNVLQLTLPGHGYARENCSTPQCHFTFADWQRAIRDGVAVAKLLGDQIVLVGNSVGGTLAIQESLTDDPQLLAMILVEPAIRVNPFLTAASCAGGLLLGDVRKWAPIAGYHPDRPLPTYLACEVDSLTRDIFDSPRKTPKFPFPLPVENLAAAGAAVRIPTLVVNNLHDFVVQSKAIRQFTASHPTTISEYPINQNHRMRHGYILEPENLPILLKAIVPFLSPL